jgi:hypothetical protein
MTVAITAKVMEAKKTTVRHGRAGVAAPAMANPMTASGKTKIIRR